MSATMPPRGMDRDRDIVAVGGRRNNDSVAVVQVWRWPDIMALVVPVRSWDDQIARPCRRKRYAVGDGVSFAFVLITEFFAESTCSNGIRTIASV